MDELATNQDTQSRGFDVFVSYASANRDVVAPFVELLKRDGFAVWFDIEQMAGGPPVLGQLADAIASSAHTIVCLSDAYIEREWTAVELEWSMHRDPSGKSARTIPVQFRPLTLEPPKIISHLTMCDLTDQKNYYRVYGQIIRKIQRPVPPLRPMLGREDLKQACDAPFQHLDEPNVALFQVRRANEALSKFLYRREIGELPANATLDLIIEQLIVSGKLPAHINAPLSIVQTYGNFVVRDQMDEFVITRESIAPALTALKVLTEWTFPERRSRDPWAEIWDSLPVGYGEERQIPDTSYSLSGPQLSRNSLGPLYAGRNASRNEPVSVNLVGIPEDSDEAFFEEVARFTRLSDASIVSPLDAGRVVVDGERRCLYLIMPWIDGGSAQDLTEHFGRFPARAAYELCLGIARALKGFHGANPPTVHGDIKPANVLIGSFGTVRVLCIGRELATAPADTQGGTSDGRIDSFLFSSPEQLSGAPLTPKTDLFALHSVLYYLLSGDYQPRGATDSAVTHADFADPGGVLERLRNCQTAARACIVLERACKSLPETPNLSTVNRLYRKEKGIVPEQKSVIISSPTDRESPLVSVSVCPIQSRKAWPLGDGLVLAWEMGTDTLAILDGPDLLWRDTHPVPVRRVTVGDGGQLAVGGWDGAVRYFADGALVAALSMDGAVGDLQFVRGGLVVGSWKRDLWRISATGQHEELLAVQRGVHRIAAAENSDRFAVANLSGGLSIYADNRRVTDMPELDSVTDLAYAAARLVILTDDALTSMGLDGSISAAENKPGALRLLSAPIAGSCMLLVETDEHRESAPVLEAWLIDEADRHVRHVTFPAGHTLLSTCGVRGRFTLSTPDGGCAYWRDGVEQQHWPDALSATISTDGRLVTVSRPGMVELYEDPA